MGYMAEIRISLLEDSLDNEQTYQISKVLDIRQKIQGQMKTVRISRKYSNTKKQK